MSRTKAKFSTLSFKLALESHCKGNCLKTRGFLIFKSWALSRDKGFVSVDMKAWRAEQGEYKMSPHPGEDTEYNARAAFQRLATEKEDLTGGALRRDGVSTELLGGGWGAPSTVRLPRVASEGTRIQQRASRKPTSTVLGFFKAFQMGPEHVALRQPMTYLRLKEAFMWRGPKAGARS